MVKTKAPRRIAPTAKKKTVDEQTEQRPEEQKEQKPEEQKEQKPEKQKEQKPEERKEPEPEEARPAEKTRLEKEDGKEVIAKVIVNEDAKKICFQLKPDYKPLGENLEIKNMLTNNVAGNEKAEEQAEKVKTQAEKVKTQVEKINSLVEKALEKDVANIEKAEINDIQKELKDLKELLTKISNYKLIKKDNVAVGVGINKDEIKYKFENMEKLIQKLQERKVEQERPKAKEQEEQAEQAEQEEEQAEKARQAVAREKIKEDVKAIQARINNFNKKHPETIKEQKRAKQKNATYIKAEKDELEGITDDIKKLGEDLEKLGGAVTEGLSVRGTTQVIKITLDNEEKLVLKNVPQSIDQSFLLANEDNKFVGLEEESDSESYSEVDARHGRKTVIQVKNEIEGIMKQINNKVPNAKTSPNKTIDISGKFAQLERVINENREQFNYHFDKKGKQITSLTVKGPDRFKKTVNFNGINVVKIE